MIHNRPQFLTDLPLWRLLVALADAERVAGSDSPSTRALARAVQEKLQAEETHRDSRWEGGSRAK